VERIPVWIMRQAGRYLPEYRAVREKHSFLDVCQTPELAVEVSLQPLRRLNVDGVIVFSDILIPPMAMGMDLRIGDGGPDMGNPIRDASGVAALHDFDPEQDTRYVCDAIRGLCRTLGGAVPVIGFAGAPWTLACYMVEGRSKDGFSGAKQFLYHQPTVFASLLDRIATNTAVYLKAQTAAGATVVQLFDTWAGELNGSDYRAFALPPTQRIVREVKAAFPSVPITLYTKATSHLLEYLVETGVDVLSLDWRVGFDDVRARVGPNVALQGNVDPSILLGPSKGIERAVRDTIRKTHGHGHILNLGHGILPNTPVENAQLFVETAKAIQISGQAGAQS